MRDLGFILAVCSAINATRCELLLSQLRVDLMSFPAILFGAQELFSHRSITVSYFLIRIWVLGGSICCNFGNFSDIKTSS